MDFDVITVTFCFVENFKVDQENSPQKETSKTTG